MHRAISDRLAGDPKVLDRARARVQKWLQTGDVASYWAREWDAVLSRSVPEIRAMLVDEGEHARALRQVTPCAGVIDPRTRWRIWREVREASERTR